MGRVSLLTTIHTNKMSFNPDSDDLHEWFFVSFMEEWRMHSSENDKEAVERLNLVCARTDKLIDWLLENMDAACDWKITKRFAQAILNTLDLDGLMGRMDEWRDNHTCNDCKLFVFDCECEEEEEDKCECCKAPRTQEHERRCEYHPRRGLYDSEESRLKEEAAFAAFIKKCGEDEEVSP